MTLFGESTAPDHHLCVFRSYSAQVSMASIPKNSLIAPVQPNVVDHGFQFHQFHGLSQYSILEKSVGGCFEKGYIAVNIQALIVDDCFTGNEVFEGAIDLMSQFLEPMNGMDDPVSNLTFDEQILSNFAYIHP